MSTNTTDHRRSRRRREEERQNYRQLMAGAKNGSSKKSSSTISEAQTIQKSLLRTHGLLQNELQRVQHVTDAIEHDQKMLEETMDSHKSLNTKQAQKALNSLQLAQRREQHVLLASMLFFVLTATYILWSRILLRLDVITPILRTIYKSVSIVIFGTTSNLEDDDDEYYYNSYHDEH